MRTIHFLISGLLTILISGCSAPSNRTSSLPLESVPNIDVRRYMGTWYEIARFPFKIQEGCFGTTANYSLEEDGKIKVINKCFKKGFDGKEVIANGTASITDNQVNSKLKVSFHFLMSLFGGGDYWIIDLAPDYSYSVVSEPQGRYLWILNRKPTMDNQTYQHIIDRLKKIGFKTENLEKTPQQPETSTL